MSKGKGRRKITMKKEFNFAGKVIAERNIERKVIVRDGGIKCKSLEEQSGG